MVNGVRVEDTGFHLSNRTERGKLDVFRHRVRGLVFFNFRKRGENMFLQEL